MNGGVGDMALSGQFLPPDVGEDRSWVRWCLCLRCDVGDDLGGGGRFRGAGVSGGCESGVYASGGELVTMMVLAAFVLAAAVVVIATACRLRW